MLRTNAMGTTPPPGSGAQRCVRAGEREHLTDSPALRPYQETAVAETEAALAAGEKVILVAPTGSGKTVMGAAIAKHTAEQHRGVLFLAHRREIIDQTCASFTLMASGTA